MDRHIANTLARFCIEQGSSFDSKEWFLLHDFDDRLVALIAKYLSMTSWYGHEEALEDIARQIHDFTGNSAGLHSESRLLDFDLPYFSTVVRTGITRARALARAQGTVTHCGRRRFERADFVML